MKIAVLGAHGKSGRAFVEFALTSGHTVRAGVRGNRSFEQHDNLEVVHCDATSASDINKLIAGQDAVVSLLGHRRGSVADVQTQAMRLLVTAMTEQGIKRIVSLTGTGVRFAGDKVRQIDYPTTWLLNLVDPKRMSDGANHVAVLQASPFDWTVLRVFKLTNGSQKAFRLSAQGPVALTSSRKTVAAALETVLSDASFIQQAPMICKP